MTTAMEKIKEEWLTLDELAAVFGVSRSRIQDMRSHGQMKIPAVKLSTKGYWYHVEDVLNHMRMSKESVTRQSEKIEEKEE